MAEVTPELIYQELRDVEARLAQLDGKIDELKQEMQFLRTSQSGILQEMLARRSSASYRSPSRTD